jgi:CheY-like chemotaxis protein
VRLPYSDINRDLLENMDSTGNLVPSSDQTTEDRPPSLPKILLAEDNAANIATFSSYLTAKGYHLIVATNGQEAIDLAQTEQPQLILMDIQMPHMDGMTAIARIRQHPQLQKIPIIALTALATISDREKCLAAGANEYLTKPVRLKQLNHSIEQWLDGN